MGKKVIFKLFISLVIIVLLCYASIRTLFYLSAKEAEKNYNTYLGDKLKDAEDIDIKTFSFKESTKLFELEINNKILKGCKADQVVDHYNIVCNNQIKYTILEQKNDNYSNLFENIGSNKTIYLFVSKDIYEKNNIKDYVDLLRYDKNNVTNIKVMDNISTIFKKTVLNYGANTMFLEFSFEFENINFINGDYKGYYKECDDFYFIHLFSNDKNYIINVLKENNMTKEDIINFISNIKVD